MKSPYKYVTIDEKNRVAKYSNEITKSWSTVLEDHHVSQIGDSVIFSGKKLQYAITLGLTSVRSLDKKPDPCSVINGFPTILDWILRNRVPCVRGNYLLLERKDHVVTFSGSYTIINE